MIVEAPRGSWTAILEDTLFLSYHRIKLDHSSTRVYSRIDPSMRFDSRERASFLRMNLFAFFEADRWPTISVMYSSHELTNWIHCRLGRMISRSSLEKRCFDAKAFVPKEHHAPLDPLFQSKWMPPSLHPLHFLSFRCVTERAHAILPMCSVASTTMECLPILRLVSLKSPSSLKHPLSLLRVEKID